MLFGLFLLTAVAAAASTSSGGARLACVQPKDVAYGLVAVEGLYPYLQTDLAAYQITPIIFVSLSDIANTTANYYPHKRAMQLIGQGWTFGCDLDVTIWNAFLTGDTAQASKIASQQLAAIQQQLGGYKITYVRIANLSDESFVYANDGSIQSSQYNQFAALLATKGLTLVSFPVATDFFFPAQGLQYFAYVIGAYQTINAYQRIDPNINQSDTTSDNEIINLLISNGYSFVDVDTCLPPLTGSPTTTPPPTATSTGVMTPTTTLTVTVYSTTSPPTVTRYVTTTILV